MSNSTYPHRQQALKSDRQTFKRLIILADGTWKSAYKKDGTHELTNVARLTRSILPEDSSTSPHIPQIVFYQTGLGTSGYIGADVLSGLTGHGMFAKIKESYAFVAHNWLPGDEILLFGFSRGAFISRMIGALIGDVGILHPNEMQNFPDLFQAYQVLGDNTADDRKKEEANKRLSMYRKGDSKSTRVIPKGTLKCIGVWDTVSALGLPRYGEGDSQPCYLGFSDTITTLGNSIQFGFHALAIDEHRGDFLPTKWRQLPEQRQAGQVLKQVWFPGTHSDVGGGYAEHELSDLALIWMVANVIENKLLAIDTQFIFSVPTPLYDWGQMKAHKSTGAKRVVCRSIDRELPTRREELTQESFHSSIRSGRDLDENLKKTLEQSPDLITDLLPFEIEIKNKWNRQGRNERLQSDEVIEEVVDSSDNSEPITEHEDVPFAGRQDEYRKNGHWMRIKSFVFRKKISVPSH